MKRRWIIISIVILVVIIVCVYFIFNKEKFNTKTEVYIKNKDNQNIFALIYRPKTNRKVPMVIYSHGLGATYRACSDYAKELLDYDIATICFDFRGGSDKSKSDGKTTEMSFLTEYDDLETVLDYVKTLNYVDKNKIILMGSSQGGAISALVSSKHDEIAGTILLYPALSIPEVIRNWYKTKEDIKDNVQMTKSITVGKKYFLDIWNLDPYEEVENDNKNILILHGTADDVVPIENSRKLNNIYKHSKLYEIEGAGHGFNDEYVLDAMDYVIEYLREQDVIK